MKSGRVRDRVFAAPYRDVHRRAAGSGGPLRRPRAAASASAGGPRPGTPDTRPAPASIGDGANRVSPHRWTQAEQEVVLQVELDVEVELVLVQPASTTSLASE